VFNHWVTILLTIAVDGGAIATIVGWFRAPMRWWRSRKKRDYLWEQNFSALKKFKRRERHCCVPTFHREGELKLGWWIATQRRNRKEMSAKRRARLNKIGFVWHAPRPYRPTGAPLRISAPNPPPLHV